MFHEEKTKHAKFIHKLDVPLVRIVTFISLFYMLILIAELYIPLSAKTFAFFVILDTFVCIVFLFEFFYFLYKAKNKSQYLKHNIVDLLASIPFLLLSGIFPSLAIFSLFKVLRGLKNIIKLYEYLNNKQVNLIGKLVFLFVITVTYFAIVIVTLERDINQGLQHFHDGVWLAITTMTSVGYGDTIPITYLGKVFSVLVMVGGIGLASAIGAVLVRWVLNPGQKEMLEQEKKIEKQEELISKQEEKIANREDKILDKLGSLEKEVQSLKQKTAKKRKKK